MGTPYTLSNLPILTEGFEASVQDSTKGRPVRVIIACVLAGVVATGLGWRPMAIWLAVVIAWELFGFWRMSTDPYPDKASLARRVEIIATIIFVSGLWLIPSLLMWLSDSPALQLAAAIQWLANLMYVQLYATKSRLFAFLSAAPPILVVAFCTIFLSPFEGSAAIAPIAVMLMALSNVALGLAGGVLHHEQLVAAVAERDETQTKLAAALEASELSERRFRMAAEMVKMRVWEVDLKNNTRESLADQVWSRVHPDDRGWVEATWREKLAKGEPYKLVHRMSGRGPTWVEAVAEVVLDANGEPDRVVGAMRDVDKEKEAERELMQARDAADAANQAKSAFLATMSHEIRTPLNGVLGMAQAMAAEDMSPRQREQLKVVRQSGETLLAILNDVLDLSKIEAGKMELEQVEFDLADVARGVHAAFAPLADSKAVALTLDIEPDAEGVYLGDPTRLRQVLYNLTGNALKFTEAGEVRITARREAGDLVLAVRDSGIGIPADRVASLFDNFTQADATTTRRFGGTGLGLAICKRMVELMGGAIDVQSTPGEGSVFTVRAPIAWVRASTGAEASAEHRDRTGAPMNLRVLAAEDNKVNQLVLSTLLGQLGLEPVIVENGLEAVGAWEREPWDVILMDVQMPQMDGLEATRRIRALEAERGAARTPIIALTADALAHQADQYVAIGMDGLVAKPIQFEQLIAALERVLDPAEESQELARTA